MAYLLPLSTAPASIRPERVARVNARFLRSALSLAVAMSVAVSCSGDSDDGPAVTSPSRPTSADLALALQIVGTRIPSRDLLPLRDESTEADIVGSGRLVGLEVGPVLRGDEPLPGFEVRVETLLLEVDVAEVVKGEAAVPDSRRLQIILIGYADLVEEFQDLRPSPVAFFLDVLTVGEFARSEGLHFGRRSPCPPRVGRGCLVERPTHPLAFFASAEGSIAYPIFGELQTPLGEGDLRYLAHVGFPASESAKSADEVT